MRSRLVAVRTLCLTALLLAVLAAIAVLVVRSRSRARASLDGLQPLLAARQFDQAQRLIDDYLRGDPENARAHILMAQVALERDDQQPRLALDHLERVKSRDRATQAIVMLNMGKAYSALAWNDRAEEAWKKALELEPRVPEAGWNLLGLYYVEGRRADAHQLAMELRRTEPDPRDRAQLLLELVRHDAQPLGSDSLVKTIEPLATNRPGDLHMAIALGLALVRTSRIDDGLAKLRELVERFNDSPDARDALYMGLDEAGKLDDLAGEINRLPASIGNDPRFDRYRGMIAEHRQEWAAAVNRFENALRHDPSDLRVLYRLSRVLRLSGRVADANSMDTKVRAAQDAKDHLLPLYEEANQVRTLGTAPHPDLYRRLADLRERMGRTDEAAAWREMVLDQ